MVMPYRTLSAEVPSALADAVESWAERIHESPAWIVERALEAYIHREKRKDEETLAALADVKAGRTVSRASVRAWIESWGTDKETAEPSSEF